ncbi:hypothetical protein V5O48_008359 [Marasmius crinis-equi]|uniref:Uncharacterized protein n=1 Tax=Marasmius crinis-equi TaxID=585013 RepID=A0ABR3FE57_9AGAR
MGDINEVLADWTDDVPRFEVFKRPQPPNTRPDAQTKRLQNRFWKAVDGLKENLTEAEDRIKKNGGLYKKNPEPWDEKVVVDGILITGQNPTPAKGVGEALLAALKK